ncbi:MAG: hypothetical protein RL095_3971 [Verrucomicrobiota bacterium]|jgi:predicted ATPase
MNASIEEIKIKNYKALRHVEMKGIPRLCFLVGANGSGKSTFFDAFSFLKDSIRDNVSVALNKRGGFDQVVTRDSEGPIEMSFKFRESGGRLATYELSVGLNEQRRPVVKREVLKFRRGTRGQAWHFLDFTEGQGSAITNEADYGKEGVKEKREEQILKSPDVLAITGLGQFQKFRIASEFCDLIDSWFISDFHIAEARPSVPDGVAEHLSTRGDNLALVARHLKENHPEIFARVLEQMKLRVPGVSQVEAKPMEDGRMLLRFQDGKFKDPFIARHVSDGTIKMFAYLVMLYDPRPFPLLAIEEPENQLYPSLMDELAEEFRAYAKRGGQAFVSTHSPDLLNGAKLDEVYWLVKKDGVSELRRASDDEQISAYMKDGDKMGYLWKQGLFFGADPR